MICKETQIVHIFKTKSDVKTATDIKSCNSIDLPIESIVKDGYSYYNASVSIPLSARIFFCNYAKSTSNLFFFILEFLGIFTCSHYIG